MADSLTRHDAMSKAAPSSAQKARRRVRIDPEPRALAGARVAVDLLIFVDFDGVLHPSKGEDGAFCHLSELSRRADDLAAQGVSVSFVVSSSWRCFAPLEEIFEALDQACPGFSKRVEGANGVRAADPSGARRLELYDYLRARPGGPPKAFLALDDRVDLFGGEALRPAWLLLTDPQRCFDAEAGAQLLTLATGLLALAELNPSASASAAPKISGGF